MSRPLSLTIPGKGTRGSLCRVGGRKRRLGTWATSWPLLGTCCVKDILEPFWAQDETYLLHRLRKPS